MVDGMEITGRLDCAMETEEGLELVDFKFTRAVSETVDPLQLQAYSLGLKKVTGYTSDILTYYYLRQERKITFPGGEVAVRDGQEQVSGLAQQLRADHSFSPQVGIGVALAAIGSIVLRSRDSLTRPPLNYQCKELFHCDLGMAMRFTSNENEGFLDCQENSCLWAPRPKSMPRSVSIITRCKSRSERIDAR